MPSRIPVYLSDQFLFDVFSDDSIILVKQKISKKTGMDMKRIEFSNLTYQKDFTWQSSFLLSQFYPLPDKIVFYYNENENDEEVQDMEIENQTIFVDENIEQFKTHIHTFFRNQKKNVHELFTVTKALFHVNFEKTIKYTHKVDKNCVCVITSESSIDEKHVMLYKDVKNIEPNQNTISGWWNDSNTKYFYPIIIKIRDEITKLNPIYHDIYLKQHLTNNMYLNYSSHEPVFFDEAFEEKIHKRVDKIIEPFVNLISTDVKNVYLKEIEFKYEVFLSIDELSNIFDSCRDLIETFFDIPNEDKPFYLTYRPKYQSNCNERAITVQFQKCKQNNSMIMYIHSFNNRFRMMQDVFEILYFLSDPKRLHYSKPTQISYKDLDPYLFKEAVKKGGFTRQCLNYKDKNLHKPIRRRKVPRILYTQKDFKTYNNLPDDHKRYVVQYRGNQYAAIDDYIYNHELIDEYNQKVDKTKKKESYLNTVVLFEIQQKYRDGTQEELFYPLCVRAKSGLPSLRHQYILKKLLDRGEIKLMYADANIMKKKLENNEKLKKGDTIHYVSKFEGKLLADIYAYLPSKLEYFLVSLPNFPKKKIVLRKGVWKGSFVHAVFECCDQKYRQLSSDYKEDYVENHLKEFQKYQSFFRYRWYSYGILSKEINYLQFKKDFIEKSHTDYRFIIDFLSEIFNVNIFVIHLNQKGELQIALRNVNFNTKKKSIVLIRWEHNYYEPILFTDDVKKKQTMLEWFQFNSDKDWLSHLNVIFYNIFSESKKIDYVVALFEYLNSKNIQTFYQIVNVYNQMEGIIVLHNGKLLMVPTIEIPMIPYLPIWTEHPPLCTQEEVDFLVSVINDFDSNYKITRLLVDENGNYTGMTIRKGLIWPIITSTQNTNSYREKDSREIPYLFGITHYRLKSDCKDKDKRCEYIRGRKSIETNLNLFIGIFRKLFDQRHIKDLWIREVEFEKNLYKKQHLIYDKMIKLCNEYIFEKLDDKHVIIKGRTEKISHEILKKIVFHLFHYIVRNQDFFERKLENIVQNENDNIIYFANIKEANQWLRNSENTIENISLQKNVLMLDQQEVKSFISSLTTLEKRNADFHNSILDHVPNFLNSKISAKKMFYSNFLQYFGGTVNNDHAMYVLLSLVLQKQIIVKDLNGSWNKYGNTFSYDENDAIVLTV